VIGSLKKVSEEGSAPFVLHFVFLHAKCQSDLESNLINDNPS
jgi:hypothetical protein